MFRSLLPALLPVCLFGQTLSIEEYAPKSQLVVPAHPVSRARYPFVDIDGNPGMTLRNLDQVIKDMDALNMRTMVILDAPAGERFRRILPRLKTRPGRFVIFANVDFTGVEDPEWSKRAAALLEGDIKAGAQGVVIRKGLGLELKDARGQRLHVDDPRFDAIWETAGRLRVPVFIESGDAKPFFDPMDRYNERWHQLREVPGLLHPPDKFPTFDAIMAEQHHVFEKHPRTIFIAAHLGWYGHDLAYLGKLLDRLPNVYTEMGAAVSELGRQPKFAYQWVLRYQDRLLFGKGSFVPEEYPVYFRVLETADEYFDYSRRRYANWQMYGLDLPDEVLKKIYYKNAARLITGLAADK
jgi:predicted TIM-barrel fold metal-dependent hydrolase